MPAAKILGLRKSCFFYKAEGKTIQLKNLFYKTNQITKS